MQSTITVHWTLGLELSKLKKNNKYEKKKQWLEKLH